MEAFDVVKIRDRAWRLWDGEKNSFYLVEGDELAAVIDTASPRALRFCPYFVSLRTSR